MSIIQLVIYALLYDKYTLQLNTCQVCLTFYTDPLHIKTNYHV